MKSINIRIADEVEVTKVQPVRGRGRGSGRGLGLGRGRGLSPALAPAPPASTRGARSSPLKSAPTPNRKTKTIVTRWGNDGTPRQQLAGSQIPEELFGDDRQLATATSLLTETAFPGCDELRKHLARKLASYEQQDRDKERAPHDGEHFTTYSELLDMLIASKMKCYYCDGAMKIAYKEVRDMTQWTLDRIDNAGIHSAGNCRVACLKCNLQKRRRDDAGFLFTKQLRIGKEHEETEHLTEAAPAQCDDAECDDADGDAAETKTFKLSI